MKKHEEANPGKEKLMDSVAVLLSEGKILRFCILNVRIYTTSSLVTAKSDVSHSSGVINCQCRAQSDKSDPY